MGDKYNQNGTPYREYRGAAKPGGDKYCTAGKCECEHHYLTGKNDWLHMCVGNKEGKCFDYKGMWAGEWEVCPWPSRIVKVEPEVKLKHNLKMVSDLYTAGFTDAIQRCREAVEKIENHFSTISIGLTEKLEVVLVKGDVFAAISKVGEEVAR